MNEEIGDVDMTEATVTTLISKDELTGFMQSMMDRFMPETDSMLDDLGEIYVEEMQTANPIGETHELNDLTMVLSEDEFTRYIFSAAGHFVPVVEGHDVFGPIFSDKQRAWWFWYLNNVLGGVYDNKTDGYLEGNPYPAEAFEMADGEVQDRMQVYMNNIMGNV